MEQQYDNLSVKSLDFNTPHNMSTTDVNQSNEKILNKAEWLDSFYFSDNSDDSSGEFPQELDSEYGTNGYMYVDFGYVFVNRYTSIRKLGWGHFSTVWLCWDMIEKRFIALKVLKSKPSYINLAYDEIKLLKILTKTDPNHYGNSHTIRFYDFFKVTSYNGTHMCMVFEVSGANLLSLIKDYAHKNEGPIVPISLLRKISLHLLRGLVYIHDVCELIHTDIKPENVVVSLDQQEIMKMAQKCYYFHFRQLLPRKYIANISTCVLKEHKKWLSEQKIKPKKSEHKFESNNKLLQNHPFVLDNDDIHELQQRHIQHCHKKFDKRSSRPSSPPNMSSKNINNWDNRIFKFCDFGNACYIDKHFSEHIQTCEYQSPEVIVNSGYNQTADIWSLACTIFELATGEYLFDPQSGKKYSREEDHLSMMIELLGDSDFQYLSGGHKFKHYFNRKFELRHIEHPAPWKLLDVLVEKYGWKTSDASDFADFLLPLLNINPKNRLSASECLKHPWLYG